MTEEKQPQPDSTAPAPPEEPPKSPARKKQSVFIYLAVLFAAAFLLLLLAYFMQQRTSEAAIGSLRDTVTTFESLDELINENQTLRKELKEQERELEQTGTELEEAQLELQTLEEEHDKYTAYTRLLETLYSAQLLADGEDYEGAQAALDALDPDFLTETLSSYDADAGSADALTPRYEALQALLEEHLPEH